MAAWRAASFVAALFAITLNFLQPLTHAALMREGVPTALWTMFCASTAAHSDKGTAPSPAPSAAQHECCLGLPHAQALIEPPKIFLPVVFALPATPPPTATGQPASVGIRDGPHRPRGPPSLV
jgi:hypothetical protein